MTRFIIYNIAAILLVFSAHAGFSAVDRYASVSIEPRQILIGEHANMSIEIEVPPGGIIIWPNKSTIEEIGIEVLRFGVPDTLSKAAKKLKMRQVHRITAWQEDYIALPPLEFLHIIESDTVLFQSAAMLFEVKTVEVDLYENLEDIKPIINIPITFSEILPYILIVLGLAVVTFLTIILIRRPKKTREKLTIWEKPSVPAHIAAISSLENLRMKKLWQQGKIKQHHSELTLILRKYLFKRYDLYAVEMTTAEIMLELPKILSDNYLTNSFNDIFVMADLVKFAKHTLGQEDHEKLLDKALEFVKSTIPREDKSQ